MAIESVEVYVMEGVEGPSLCIGGRRVSGPKAWGGGQVIYAWKVPIAKITEAVTEGRGEVMQYRCRGCGDFVEPDHGALGHTRAEHAPGCDGHNYSATCPIPVTCGPVDPVDPADPDPLGLAARAVVLEEALRETLDSLWGWANQDHSDLGRMEAERIEREIISPVLATPSPAAEAILEGLRAVAEVCEESLERRYIDDWWFNFKEDFPALAAGLEEKP